MPGHPSYGWRHLHIIVAFTCVYSAVSKVFRSSRRRRQEETIGSTTVPFLAGIDGYLSYRIPAIVVHPETKDLMAFAEGRPEKGGDLGKHDIVSRRSTDKGKTWGKILLVAADNTSSANTTYANPCPVADPVKGIVRVLFTINNTFVMEVQTTDGKSWSELKNHSKFLANKGWGHIATGPGHGITTKNGTVVVPFNRVLNNAAFKYEGSISDVSPWYDSRSAASRDWSAKLTVTGDKDETYEVEDAKLTDFEVFGNSGAFINKDGKWRVGGILQDLGSNENMIAELASGSMLMSVRMQHGPNKNGCRHFSSSDDGGQSWSVMWAPKTEGLDSTSCLPDPMCQSPILVLPTIDGCDSSKETVIVVTPGSSEGRSNTTVWMSTDDAVSFKFLSQLTEASDLGGYSDVVKLGAEGCVHTLGVIYEAYGHQGGAIAFTTIKVDFESELFQT